MKTLGFLLVLLTFSNNLVGQSQAAALCQQVTAPTIEQSTSDYRRLQSFMSLNSGYEYDRLQKIDSSARGGEASYKMFSAEYNESNTREEFSEKVRQRLSREEFNLSESDARSYARRGLTDTQVNAWASCVQQVTGAGGLLLSPRSVTADGFTLIVTRVFPQGVGRGGADITVTGGVINAKTSLTDSYEGNGSTAYEVVKSQDAKAVRISGTLMRTFTDSVLVDYVVAPPPPKKFEKRFDASAIDLGGYVTRGHGLIVSGSAAGGPSENSSIEVDMPRAGMYSVEAMWTAAVQTEVHVYSKAMAKSCTDPNLNMDDAALHYLPSVTGGWDAGHLPNYPDYLGNLLLPKGKTRIIFTSRSCGGGLGGGRVPSTKWVRFREL